MQRERTQSSVPMRGALVFVALVFGLTWAPAWLLAGSWLGAGRPLVTRLLTCSLFYAIAMGWQPLAATWAVRRWIDPPGYLDHGLKPARSPYLLVASVAPIALMVFAAGLAWLLGLLGAPMAGALQPNPEPELAVLVASWGHAIALALALLGTATLVWVQALAEEIGWRGYFMTRLMQRFGAWKGLFLHGLVWGFWYAPIFMFGNRGFHESLPRGAGFVLTCALLGALLGWLRLASRSIVPTTVANALLTLGAGLPFLLQGVDVGLRGAAYGPAGWLCMGVAIVGIAIGRCRDAVRTPSATPPGSLHRLWLAVDSSLGFRGRGPRDVLH